MPYDSLKTLTQDADALIEAIRAFHVRCAQDLAKAARTEAELRREIAALKGEKEPLVWPKLADDREQGISALNQLMARWGACESAGWNFKISPIL